MKIFFTSGSTPAVQLEAHSTCAQSSGREWCSETMAEAPALKVHAAQRAGCGAAAFACALLWL